jgi:hypothetical protein
MITTKDKPEIKDDILHKYLIKKIRRAVNDNQSILHLSNKQNQITEIFSKENFYTKQENFDGLNLEKESFSQIVLDLDMPNCDEFKKTLDICKKILFKHGHLIIIASNMCSFKNKINFLFENRLEGLSRPNRAVTPGFLRQTLIEKGFQLNNRGWQYDEKLLVIVNKPN